MNINSRCHIFSSIWKLKKKENMWFLNNQKETNEIKKKEKKLSKGKRKKEVHLTRMKIKRKVMNPMLFQMARKEFGIVLKSRGLGLMGKRDGYL